MSVDSSRSSLLDDRDRFGQLLLVVGVIGVVGALVAGVAGWLVAGRATETLEETLEPVSAIVVNVTEAVDASRVMVARTGEALDSIESATRSTARALTSMTQVLDETSEVVGGGVADGLEAAVDSLPALVDTGRVIDRTMRALSLVGVDYDPAVPLDESLQELEDALAPLPEQLRAQVALLEEVRDDVDQIAADSETLAGVLQETRIDLMEVDGLLEAASENTDDASESIDQVRADLGTYDTLAKVAVVAVTIALLAAASAPLAIGLHFRRSPESL